MTRKIPRLQMAYVTALLLIAGGVHAQDAYKPKPFDEILQEARRQADTVLKRDPQPGNDPEFLKAEEIFEVTRQHLSKLDKEILAIEDSLVGFAKARKSKTDQEIIDETVEHFDQMDAWLLKAHEFLKTRQPADVTAFEDLINHINVTTADMPPDTEHYRDYMQKREQLEKYIEDVKAKYSQLQVEVLATRKLMNSKGRHIKRKLTMLLLERNLEALDALIDEVRRLRSTIHQKFVRFTGDAT